MPPLPQPGRSGEVFAVAGNRGSQPRVPWSMGELQPTHILLVLLVVVVLFGGSRLSNVGKGLGEGIRHFKKAIRDDADAPDK